MSSLREKKLMESLNEPKVNIGSLKSISTDRHLELQNHVKTLENNYTNSKAKLFAPQEDLHFLQNALFREIELQAKLKNVEAQLKEWEVYDTANGVDVGLIDYDFDYNLIVTIDKRNIEPIPALNHKEIDHEPFISDICDQDVTTYG
ncbi:hypothetical protein SUGI_0459880 [Cryptomeria japonica]|nr:hypothetical protein SUGI_0459880 [Cryptomeria japonica]